jgi:G:T/U-mismatch repair DNA glycosylase
MSAVIYQLPENRDWQALYKAAIVEVDSTKQAERIAEAKKLIVARARELFQMSGDHFQEKQALDAAIGVLHALQTTLKRRPTVSHLPGNGLKTTQREGLRMA